MFEGLRVERGGRLLSVRSKSLSWSAHRNPIVGCTSWASARPHEQYGIEQNESDVPRRLSTDEKMGVAGTSLGGF